MIFAYTLIALLGSPIPSAWMDALALVESGDNPQAVGRHGERTRYQVTPAVWRQHTKVPMQSAGPNTIRGIVSEEWSRRIATWEIRNKRKCDPRTAYLLWHRPARWNNPTRVELERAMRFENLAKR